MPLVTALRADDRVRPLRLDSSSGTAQMGGWTSRRDVLSDGLGRHTSPALLNRLDPDLAHRLGVVDERCKLPGLCLVGGSGTSPIGERMSTTFDASICRYAWALERSQRATTYSANVRWPAARYRRRCWISSNARPTSTNVPSPCSMIRSSSANRSRSPGTVSQRGSSAMPMLRDSGNHLVLGTRQKNVTSRQRAQPARGDGTRNAPREPSRPRIPCVCRSRSRGESHAGCVHRCWRRRRRADGPPSTRASDRCPRGRHPPRGART